MAYDGSITLISGITQANGGNFPLVDSTAVRVDDETRLDAKLTYIANSISEVNSKLDELLRRFPENISVSVENGDIIVTDNQ